MAGVALLLLLCVDAHAATDNINVLDSIVQELQNTTQHMAERLIGYASTLFWSLALIQMVWTFGMLALRKADLAEFFAELLRFTITLGFFWWLLSNAVTGMNIAGTIIQSMRDMGAQATGLGQQLMPSNIVDAGFGVLKKVTDATLGVPETIVAYAVAIMILLIFAAIGVNMVLVLAESWFLLYGGLFVLGFGGSRWTSDMAITYYRQVLGVGFKLFGMAAIVGIGTSFVDGYVARLSANARILEMCVMLIAAYVFYKLSDRIPAMLAGLVAGGGSSGVGGYSPGAVAGAAWGAAGAAAAAAATGGRMLGAATANLAGGAQALMAAVSKASENVSSGSDVMTSMLGGGGGGSSSSSSSSTGSTPFAQAAGFSDAGSSGSSMSRGGATGGQKSQGSNGGLLASATKAGKIAADAGANLAKGAAQLAAGKYNDLKESAKDRIADTTGGKIAAAIKGAGQDSAPTFSGNSLSGDKNVDAESEVAAFANREDNKTA
jgi:type IV secretion system protein VirB6/type IV secretion system protein TrbL